MEKIHRIAYGLSECCSFLYALAHGLSDGKAGCDHEDVYFTKEAFEKDEFDKNLPIPLLVNLIDLEKNERDDLITKLSKGLQNESERISTYLEFSQPFIKFAHHDVDYQVTSKGLLVKPFQEIIGSSLYPIPLFDWAVHDTGINTPMFWALSTANHQRFFRKFSPSVFEQKPGYAPLQEQDKKLVGEYAQMIKHDDPENARELEALV